MLWKQRLLHFLVLIAVLCCPIDSKGVSLHSRRGFVLQAVVVADSKLISLTSVNEVFQRANDLTSFETNIHIQVPVNHILDKSNSSSVQAMKNIMKNILDAFHLYWRNSYDLVFLLTDNPSLSLPNSPRVPQTACQPDSVVFINLMDKSNSIFSTEVVAKFVAGSIYRTVFSFNSSSMITDCKKCYPKRQACLSSNYFLNTVLNDTVCQHVREELGICLSQSSLMTGNGTFSSLTIHRNGVKEDGEDCDCFFRQTRCQETCDKFGKKITVSASVTTEVDDQNSQPNITPSKTVIIITIIVVSASLITVIIVYVVVVIVRRIMAKGSTILKFQTIKTVNSSVFVT